jgi:hypothetical protein
MKKLTYSELLESVKAFIPDKPEIISIIKLCGLQPVDEWYSWVDGAGNELCINKNKNKNNKRISIKINKESSVLTNNIRDIYFKSDIKSILKNSSYALIALCDDMNTYLLWFKGKDGWLRFLSYKDGDLNHFFPLTSGFEALRYFFINEFIVKNDKNKINNYILPWAVKSPWVIPEPYNLTIKKIWSTLLPISSSMNQDLLQENNKTVLSLIKL